MKNITLLFILTFLSFSCAHHHKDAEHHHHKDCDKNCKINHSKNEMFNKNCAQSVLEGKLHVKGSEEFKLNHGSRTYYFSSKKKLEQFKEHIEVNALNAQKIWRASSFRR